jgi:Family of unknown function (DUF6869)
MHGVRRHNVSVDPQVVRDWVALAHEEEGSAEYDRHFAAYDVVSDMVHERPDDAWNFILEALKLDASVAVVEVLSAGPLEDLLGYHGDRVIAHVEREARNNPAFAKLLGGVWRGQMTPEIWARVQSVWDRRGWDGIPAA